MNVIDYLALSKAYSDLTSVILRNVSTGDQKEDNYINNLRLGDISKFLQEYSTKYVVCQRCNGTGLYCYHPNDDGSFESNICHDCNGNGGFFKEEEIEVYL